MREQAEEEESLFSTCAGKLHCTCEEFKLQHSALPGGQDTSLRKDVLNFVLICREEELLLVEEGLSVPPPSFGDASSYWHRVRQDYCHLLILQ